MYSQRKDRTHPELKINENYECDIETTSKQLDAYCSDCDFEKCLRGQVRKTENKENKKSQRLINFQ